jgi:mono/diheme cytochrome c family protein
MKKNSIFFLAGGLCLLASTLISGTNTPVASYQGPLQASIKRGKQVYLEQCLACHQVDGLGVQGMNPPLVKTKFVLGDKTTLVKIVLNGMSGVEVDGGDYHGVMAAHPDLNDQQIADALTYVRNSWGNKATAVTAAQVKAIRATNKPPATQ